jgi:hypothetical protein
MILAAAFHIKAPNAENPHHLKRAPRNRLDRIAKPSASRIPHYRYLPDGGGTIVALFLLCGLIGARHGNLSSPPYLYALQGNRIAAPNFWKRDHGLNPLPHEHLKRTRRFKADMAEADIVDARHAAI